MTTVGSRRLPLASRVSPSHRVRGSAGRTDVILPTQDPFMDEILQGKRTHEFRKYLIADSVRRIWYYQAAPHSRIQYFCEIEPAHRRGPGLPLLQGDGLGVKEFNECFDGNWEGFDYAYRILSVYKLAQPIKLQTMRNKYNFRLAPRSLVYLPTAIAADVDWRQQMKLRVV